MPRLRRRKSPAAQNTAATAAATPTAPPAAAADTAPARRRGGPRLTRASWRGLGRLGVAGLFPPFALAFFSLTQPWARARIVLFWGLTRSPEAVALLLAGLGTAFAAGVAVAWTGRRPNVTALVHLAFGLLLGSVAWQAYALVRDAGVRALGFVPIASVRPGRGLYFFAAAALALVLLGLLELALAAWRGQLRPARRRRSRPAA